MNAWYLAFLLPVLTVFLLLIWYYLIARVREEGKAAVRKLEKDQDEQRKLCKEINELLLSLRESVNNHEAFTAQQRLGMWKNQHNTIKHKLSLLENSRTRDIESLDAILDKTDNLLPDAFNEYERHVHKFIN